MYVAVVQMQIAEPDHDEMVKLSLSSTPKFVAAKADGLLMKYYVSGSAGLGGIYIWNTREDAEAWYTPEWYEFMKEHYAEATVTFYDSFVQVDNINDQVIVNGVPQ
ncbi:MAG: monooxygenase [Gammaproteobacteria bacterium]|nr:monooxygenase [Gammaproteobacteria bacterium]